MWDKRSKSMTNLEKNEVERDSNRRFELLSDKR